MGMGEVMHHKVTMEAGRRVLGSIPGMPSIVHNGRLEWSVHNGQWDMVACSRAPGARVQSDLPPGDRCRGRGGDAVIKLWIVVMLILAGDVIATVHAPWQIAVLWVTAASMLAGIYIGIKVTSLSEADRDRAAEQVALRQQDEMFRDGGWS